MAQITGLTAARMLEIEAESVVDGHVSGDNLILTRHDGTEIDAGSVRGPVGTPGKDAAPGSVTPTANTTPIRTADGRVKTATPTEVDDSTTKKYVDDLTAPLAAKSYVDGLVKAKDLPNNADLNAYTTPGVYVQGSNTGASSGTNYPKPIAGVLEVLGGAPSSPMLWQRYTLYTSYQLAKFERAFYNNAWGPWSLVSKGTTTTTITSYTNSFTWANTSADNPVLTQRNGMVQLDGRLKQTAGFTGGAAFTIPSGFRPLQNVNNTLLHAFNAGSTPGPPIYANITTAGVVNINKADNSTTPAWGSGTWMNLHFTYIAEDNY